MSGDIFSQWVVITGNPQIADPNASTTTLTMPAGNVTVKATYKSNPIGGTLAINTSKKAYNINEAIVVNYDGLPGNSQDWIGLFKAGDSHQEYGQWFYTKGAKSGTMNFNGLSAGQYEARLFFKDSYNLEHKVAFTIK